jgi:hypothetical protein
MHLDFGNNILNPLTPFGNGSLIRMANIYANIAQAIDPAKSTIASKWLRSNQPNYCGGTIMGSPWTIPPIS